MASVVLLSLAARVSFMGSPLAPPVASMEGVASASKREVTAPPTDNLGYGWELRQLGQVCLRATGLAFRGEPSQRSNSLQRSARLCTFACVQLCAGYARINCIDIVLEPSSLPYLVSLRGYRAC